MKKIAYDKKILRTFGLTMAIAFLIISGIFYLKKRQTPAILPATSIVFLLAAIIRPRLLKWVYVFWMRLALVLSWINTRVLLVITFYLIFTPIALILKLLGVDLLDRKLERMRESYWKKRDTQGTSKEGYERQF